MKHLTFLLSLFVISAFSGIVLNTGLRVELTRPLSFSVSPDIGIDLTLPFRFDNLSFFPYLSLGVSEVESGLGMAIPMNYLEMSLRLGAFYDPLDGIYGLNFEIPFKFEGSFYEPFDFNVIVNPSVGLRLSGGISAHADLLLGIDPVPSRKLKRILESAGLKRCGNLWCTEEDALDLKEMVYIDGVKRRILSFERPIVEVSLPPERVHVVNLKSIRKLLGDIRFLKDVIESGSTVAVLSNDLKIVSSGVRSEGGVRYYFDSRKFHVISRSFAHLRRIHITDPVLGYGGLRFALEGDFPIDVDLWIVPKLPKLVYVVSKPEDGKVYSVFGDEGYIGDVIFFKGKFRMLGDGERPLDILWRTFDPFDVLKNEFYKRGDEIYSVSMDTPFDLKFTGDDVDLVVEDGKVKGRIGSRPVVRYSEISLKEGQVVLIPKDRLLDGSKPSIRHDGIELKVVELPWKNPRLSRKCFLSGENLIGKTVEVVDDNGLEVTLKVDSSSPMYIPSGVKDLRITLDLSFPEIPSIRYTLDSTVSVVPEPSETFYVHAGEKEIRGVNIELGTEPTETVFAMWNGTSFELEDPASRVGVFSLGFKGECGLNEFSKLIVVPSRVSTVVAYLRSVAGLETAEGTAVLIDELGNVVYSPVFESSIASYDGESFTTSGLAEAGRMKIETVGSSTFMGVEFPVDLILNLDVEPASPERLAFRIGEKLVDEIAVPAGRGLTLDLVALDGYGNVVADFRQFLEIPEDATFLKLEKSMSGVKLEKIIMVVKLPERIDVENLEHVHDRIFYDVKVFDGYGREIEADLRYTVDGVDLEEPVVPVHGTHELVLRAVPKVPEGYTFVGTPTAVEVLTVHPPERVPKIESTAVAFEVFSDERVLKFGRYEGGEFLLLEEPEGEKVLYLLKGNSYKKIRLSEGGLVKINPITREIFILSGGKLEVLKESLETLKENVETFDIDEHGVLWTLEGGDLKMDGKTVVEDLGSWKDILVCGGRWVLYKDGAIYRGGDEFEGENPSWKPDCSAVLYTKGGDIYEGGEKIYDGKDAKILEWVSNDSFLFLDEGKVGIWMNGRVEFLSKAVSARLETVDRDKAVLRIIKVVW